MNNQELGANFVRWLQNARAQREQPAPSPAEQEAAKLRAALFHYFEPVYRLMDEMHRARVAFPGLDPDNPRIVPPGATFRREAEETGIAPRIELELDPGHTLRINLATIGQPRTVRDLADCKYRCRVTSRDNRDVRSELVASPEGLASWLADVIAEFEYRSDREPSTAVTHPVLQELLTPLSQPPEEPLPRRELRSIDLD